jgi:hypothetical protein
MSEDRPIPTMLEGVVSEEQLAKISGGDCTPAEIQKVFDDLKGSYDSLIDFTSYVFERVIGK